MPTVAMHCKSKGCVMDRMLHALAGAALIVALIVGLIAWPPQDRRARECLALAGGLAVVAGLVLIWT